MDDIRVFEGIRDDEGTCHITLDGVGIGLGTNVVNHSPTGLEWGYEGSGPAQAALAILLAYGLPVSAAIDMHQHFKAQVMSGLPHDGWRVRATDIGAWISALRKHVGTAQARKVGRQIVDGAGAQ